MYNDFFNQ